MARNMREFREEYRSMSDEERRHLKKLIVIGLAFVLIPVIFGIGLAAGLFPLWSE